MPDISEIIAKARPRELTVRICLAGDVAAEVDRLEAELQDVSQWQSESIADENPGLRLAEQIKDARERMRQAEAEFTFRALGDRAWSDLVAKHPGKTEEDAWDPDSLAPALVSACAVEPVMTAEQVGELFEVLNQGQRQQLIDAAWQVNGEATPVPFSLHASAILASHTGEK